MSGITIFRAANYPGAVAAGDATSYPGVDVLCSRLTEFPGLETG